MGLFNIFKKDKKESATAHNNVLGPTFLDGLTEPITQPKNLQQHEWRRKLRTTSGQTKFKIKYFGQLHHDHKTLIVGTNDTPPLVFAVEPVSGEEILIFDGCRHGYNAMFCDNYSEEQRKRTADKIYKTTEGTEIFEVTISTYYGIDYDDEFASKIDEDGCIALIDGTKMKFETVKRNGFDTLQILGSTDNGDIVEIVSEELA